MLKCLKGYEVQVCKSNMVYIGTKDAQGFPNCRCSDYFKNKEQAQQALDSNTFKERKCAENEYCNGFRGCNIKDRK